MVGNKWLISYPWKQDPKKLPNNEVQARKKLEATERHLSKTPKNAAVYDREMIEMTAPFRSHLTIQREQSWYKRRHFANVQQRCYSQAGPAPATIPLKKHGNQTYVMCQMF